MVANADAMSSVTKNISLVADDISQFGYKQSNELFAMSRTEAETMQLGWARRRFEELAPQPKTHRDRACVYL
jgi:hypothetical protein